VPNLFVKIGGLDARSRDRVFGGNVAALYRISLPSAA